MGHANRTIKREIIIPINKNKFQTIKYHKRTNPEKP